MQWCLDLQLIFFREKYENLDYQYLDFLLKKIK
jgi:hypothetical protein